MTSELKPCPFCGEIDLLKGQFKDTKSHYIICLNCGAQKIDDHSADACKQRWNTRADHFPDAGKMVENARLKELIRWCVNAFGNIEFEDGFPNMHQLPDCPEKQEIEKLLEKEWKE